MLESNVAEPVVGKCCKKLTVRPTESAAYDRRSMHRIKQLMVIALVACSVGAIIPSISEAAEIRSVNQNSGMTCDEAKVTVYRWFAYTVNSATCFNTGTNSRRLYTDAWYYDVSKRETGVWPNRTWYSQVVKTHHCITGNPICW
jgi:hypothetical protein